jgi:hypothetical protein
MMPFCVSSFSALIKGQGFVLIFSPLLSENIVASSVCGAFLLTHFGLRWARPERAVAREV